MSFTVSLTARSNTGYDIPAGLTITPQEWSGIALGGFDTATLEVAGPRDAVREVRRWLLYAVQILDDSGRVVWDGYINEIELRLGGAIVTLSVERMYNAVRVLYSFSSPDGGSDTDMTDWLTDAASINEYGRKELLHSAGGEVSQQSAEALRLNVLNAQKAPIPTMRVEKSTSADGATLSCYGRYRTLDWRYHEDTTGYAAHEENNGRVLLGWAVSGANRFGFVGEGQNRILDFSGGLADLEAGDYIRVTGSASNNLSLTVDEGTAGDIANYTASTISFSPGNDIDDSAGGFGFARTLEGIKVAGSPNNDGYYLLGDVVTAAHMEITTSFGASPVVSDSAGPSVRIDMAHNVQVGSSLTHEIPSGSTVTVQALATKVAQSFQITDGPWAAGEIVISVGKKGAPLDSLTVALYSDSAGSPGTLLGSGTIAPADIPYSADWMTATLSSPVTLANATTYWIVITRGGSVSATDYFFIGADTDAGYGSGEMKLYNGSSWVAAPTASDMPFQVWGVLSSTDKISRIVDTSSSAFVTDTSIVTASGVTTRRKRDGKSTGWTEINDLLEQGTSTGSRLNARVDMSGNLIVSAEEAPSMLSLIWQDDGTITYSDGQALPQGVLPFGRWVTIGILTSADWTADISGFLCDSATYSPGGGWQLTPRGAPDPFDLGDSQG